MGASSRMDSEKSTEGFISRMFIVASVISLVFASVASAEAGAGPSGVGGHLKLEGAYSRLREGDLRDLFGTRDNYSSFAEGRLNLEKKQDKLELVFHSEGTYAARTDGRSRAAIESLQLFSACASDRCRLMDLNSDLLDEDSASLVARGDRLYAGYTSESLVARLGRQAITWGNGLFFQALDPFNPFSPTETDKDYKVGDDMAYLQQLFADGSDLQLLLLPRRDPGNRDVETDRSSLALKFKTPQLAGFYWDAVAASHYGERLFGLGLNRNVGSALLRADLAVVDRDGGKPVPSGLVNLDYGFTLFGRNFYAFVEYYHNDFGVSPGSYTMPTEDLADRIARGEIFTLGRDYAAAGARIEWTPLLNVYPSYIRNLHDTSGIFQVRGVYEARADLAVTAGINLPAGAPGSELGGIEIADPAGGGETRRLAPGRELYLRLTYFF